MQEIKNNQTKYNKEPINAIITKHTIIPGISGKKINLNKSYNKMQKINEYNPSLLVYDKINPNKSISNHFDKVIISGNQEKKDISIILEINNEYLFNTLNQIIISNNLYLDILTNNNYNLHNTNFKNIIQENYSEITNYCITYEIKVNKKCQSNHKYTILVSPITNYHLLNTKSILKNGIILLYSFNENNYQDLNIILRYIKNNHYNIVPINKLLYE